MDSLRFAQIESLFHTVLGYPPEQWHGELTSRESDTQIVAEVERLLARHAEGESLLKSALDAVTSLAAPMQTQIGAYRILDELGAGGMGTVLLAERLLGDTPQKVALKLIRGIPTASARERLARERALLAELNHPNIARLLDAGETPDRVPYLAMEYIDGAPLLAYCDMRALDVPARLQLFASICRAVQHAHQHLIVHRDIKPANILVRDDGTPVLLDFGIGKLIDPGADEHTATHAFTPAYAAPEQRAGGRVTTATDIWGLGCVLYELVSGRSLRETRVDDRVTRPSAAVRDPARVRQLRGDIDNIVMKALDADPVRRYASAGALAEDVASYLDGHPVAAHAPTRWYRAGKFIQRHRSGVIAAALLTLAVLVALAFAMWEASVARRQAVRASALHDFMVTAFEEAEPGKPREGPPRITEVVERAIASARRNVDMDRSVRTELLSELGAVLRDQGKLQQARETLQWNFDQARESFGDEALPTLTAGRELLMTMILIGDFNSARTLADRLLAAPEGDAALRSLLLADSADLATKQNEITRALSDGQAARDAARRAGGREIQAEAASLFAKVQLAADDPAGAAKTYEELLALREREHGPEHVTVAAAHAGASRAYRRIGDYDAAEKHIRAALAIDALVLPKDDWRHANHLNALMVLERTKRDFSGALDAANEGLRINRIAYGDDSPEVANDMANIGRLQMTLERPIAAVPPFREALALTQTKFGPEHRNTAIARADYGMALAQSGDAVAGEAEIHHAIASLEQAAEPDLEAQATAWESLARLRLDSDDGAAALPSIDHIDGLLAKHPKLGASWRGRVAWLRASAQLLLDQPVTAKPQLELASAELARSKAPDAVMQVEVPMMLAVINAKLGDTRSAKSFADSGLALFAQLPSPPRRTARLAKEVRNATQ